jgi:cytochrome c oxidase subunit IV
MRLRLSANRRPPRILVFAWVGLLALLTLTVFAAYLPLGAVNTVVALAIAATKAALVAAIFMELRERNSLMLTFAIAGFFWLSIMLWLAFSDYLTRPNFPPGRLPFG